MPVETAALASGTRGSVALVNATSTFACSSTATRHMRWNYYAPSGDLVPVYSGIAIKAELKSRYTVRLDVAEETSELVIRNVKSSDAGMYCCLEHAKSTWANSFQLIVLGE